jgi:hypothetical protein
VYGDEWPESLLSELFNFGETEDYPWLCPDFPIAPTQYVLGHDPTLSLGTNFNFVVNLCMYAFPYNKTVQNLTCETDLAIILDNIY